MADDSRTALDEHAELPIAGWVEFLGEHPNAATERVETTEVHAA